MAIKIKSEYYFFEEDAEAVGTFAILWAAFEKKYFDRECKMDLIKKSRICDYNQDILHSAEELRNCIMAFAGNDYAYAVESLRLKEKDIPDIQKFIQAQEALQDEKRIKSALMICCRIRNNMFHGEKDIYTLPNQRPLFCACIDLLDELLSSNAKISQ